MNEESIKLLYIEDHPVMVRGFRDIFRSSRDDVTMTVCANGVEEAIKKVKPGEFDLIILDLFLGDADPVCNILQLSAHFGKKPIIIYTGHTGVGLMKDAFASGVKAWVAKTAEKPEIKETIIRVYRGETIYPQELIRYHLNPEAELSAITKTTGKFTPDKQQLLIMAWLSEGKTSQEIAAKHLKVTLSTVEKKLQAMRELAEVKTNCELVAFYLRNCAQTR
jgi:DNA-binding NarL/FixJ family response regulator